MKAGFCSECGTNVYLTRDGRCINGHEASSVTNTYEVSNTGDGVAGDSAVGKSTRPSGMPDKRLIAVALAVIVLAAVGVQTVRGLGTGAERRRAEALLNQIEGDWYGVREMQGDVVTVSFYRDGTYRDSGLFLCLPGTTGRYWIVDGKLRFASNDGYFDLREVRVTDEELRIDDLTLLRREAEAAKLADRLEGEAVYIGEGASAAQDDAYQLLENLAGRPDEEDTSDPDAALPESGSTIVLPPKGRTVELTEDDPEYRQIVEAGFSSSMMEQPTLVAGYAGWAADGRAVALLYMEDQTQKYFPASVMCLYAFESGQCWYAYEEFNSRTYDLEELRGAIARDKHLPDELKSRVTDAVAGTWPADSTR